MSKTIHSIKLVAYDSVDLDRLSYSNGDVVYDITNGTLRLMNGTTAGGSKMATQTWVQNSAGTIHANLVGNVTGSVSGNAGTVTNGVYVTDTGTVTNTMLAGLISNNKLVNHSLTIGSTQIDLGGITTTLSGLTAVSSTSFTGELTGNASTATTLQTSRTINGVAFNGSTNITVTADANTLTNTTLNATVVNSSLTSVGTLTTVTVAGDITANSNVNVSTLPTNNVHATNKKYVDTRALVMSIAMS